MYIITFACIKGCHAWAPHGVVVNPPPPKFYRHSFL